MSTARTKANNRWNIKSYDRVEFTVPKGEKLLITEAAKKAGVSTNAFIKEAVKEKMERNNTDIEEAVFLTV